MIIFFHELSQAGNSRAKDLEGWHAVLGHVQVSTNPFSQAHCYS